MRALVFASCLLSAAPAWAHQAPPERRLIVQLDDAGAVALLELSLKGREATMVAAAHERDGSAGLSAAERGTLGPAVIAKAARGLGLALDGEVVRVALLRTDVVQEAGEPSKAALAVTAAFELALPEAAARPDLHTFSITVPTTQRPVLVQLQCLGAWRVVPKGVRVAADGRGLAVPLTIEPGTTLELVVTKMTPSGAGR